MFNDSRRRAHIGATLTIAFIPPLRLCLALALGLQLAGC
ncbi:MAG: hypothetical protein FD139_3799, partial [Methylocystaceae bacterium]